jgi:hypothetical protein
MFCPKYGTIIAFFLKKYKKKPVKEAEAEKVEEVGCLKKFSCKARKKPNRKAYIDIS